MINIFQPSLGSEELAAIEQVFKSNWLGKGKVTDQFEAEFASHIGVDAAQISSTTCCTEGLFQAMPLLDIGAGDEVILPSIHFVGAANAIAASGARPIFCDVDPRTLNPTSDTIAEKITARTKAVVILHYGGRPCVMTDICQLTQAHGLYLIEDSACSVASRYQGQACGTLGDVGVWSFDAMKILVTGDGGMVYCRQPALNARLKAQLYLGLQQSSGYTNSAQTRWWEFEISSSERRAVMNDITAAMGREQLKKLPNFIKRRQQIHKIYTDELSDLTWLQTPPPMPDTMESSYYFYWIQTQPPWRDGLATYLRDHNIYTTFRYYPLHWVNHYQTTVKLPHADWAAQSTLCLPIHQDLSESEAGYIIEHIKRFGQKIL